MKFKKVEFKGHDGSMLAGRLDLPPAGAPVACALFAHCFTCSKNIKAAGNICRALANEGFAVLRFDFTGLGESQGEFANTNFSSNVEDLIAAAHYLEQNYLAPKILIGHSLGGAAVLQAARHIKACKAVATIAAPADPKHVEHLFGTNKSKIETEGVAQVNLAGRNFTIKKQFLDDLEQTHMENEIRQLKKALLVFHSPLDDVVGVENAAAIFQAARHPKSFVSLDQADHLLSASDDSIYVGAVIAAWARKYLPAPATDHRAATTNPTVVTRTGAKGFKTQVTVNGHAMIADEPIAYGGTDLGPTPYDYLLAGLGACTSMTLRMYADRKAWPLHEAVVQLTHKKIHAEDCKTCSTKTGQLDQIDREIELIGPLDAQQMERLLQIADRCPVHRTLHSEIVVKTRLKESSE